MTTDFREQRRERTRTLVPEVRRAGPCGFTLVELLVVIVIIGVLASIAVPSFKGLGQAHVQAAANRQVLDDIDMARLRALNGRTVVYLVFMPPATDALRSHLARLDAADRRVLSNLFEGQFRSYALLAERSVGDQPGAGRPRYLSEWKTLPDGFLFPDFKYARNTVETNDYLRPFPEGDFPFPTARSPQFRLPYIAFNSQGQLVERVGGILVRRDQVIPLARGSVLIARDKQGNIATQKPADVLVTPKDNFTNNYIRVSWLTGRTALEKPEVR